MGWMAFLLNPCQNELTWLTPMLPQLELGDSTLEHDILEKVDLSGCAEWDPMDQQEVRKILREYANVFAKDDLNLGQTSVIKHKITLKEGAKLIKECIRRFPPGFYDEVQKHLKEIIDVGAI